MVPKEAVADPEEEVREDKGGPSDTPDTTDNEDVVEPGEESDIDSGGEAGKVKEPGEEDGGEDEAEPVDETPTIEERFAALEAEHTALKEKLSKPEESKSAPPAPVQLTDGQKAEIAERFGMEFRSVEAVNNLVNNAVAQVAQRFIGELGAFKKDAALVRLSKDKDFADIEKYRPGIDEFLKKFKPEFHGNEEILKDAYWIAKGKGSGTVVKKALNNQEKNRKVVSKTRPASPAAKGGGGGGKGKMDLRLSSQERSAYESFAKGTGMSEEDYARGLSRNRGA